MKNEVNRHQKSMSETVNDISKEVLNKMKSISPISIFQMIDDATKNQGRESNHNLKTNENLKDILNSILDWQIAHYFMDFVDMYDDTSINTSLDDMLLEGIINAKKNKKIPFDFDDNYLESIMNACKSFLNNDGTISACAEYHLSLYMANAGKGFLEADVEKMKLCIRETINPNKQTLLERFDFDKRNQLTFYEMFGIVQEWDFYTIGKHLYFTNWFISLLKTQNTERFKGFLPPAKSKFEYLAIAEIYMTRKNNNKCTLPF